MTDRYLTYFNEGYVDLNLKDLINESFLMGTIYGPETIWSGRLGSGILGEPHCKAGNRGPKGYNEVIFALSDEGLNKLVKLGFVPCPVCKPEEGKYSSSIIAPEDFWDRIEESVLEKYGINTLAEFKELPFDSRRVDWGELMPMLKKGPDRLYVPQGLHIDDLVELRERFEEKMGVNLPAVGFYDKDVPGRFSEYGIPV